MTTTARIPFQESQRWPLDANGRWTFTFNGPPSWTRRALSTVVVSCYPPGGMPCTATVYRSTISTARRMAASRRADSDELVADGEILETGEPLFVVFEGGTPGVMACVNVYGDDYRAQ